MSPNCAIRPSLDPVPPPMPSCLCLQGWKVALLLKPEQLPGNHAFPLLSSKQCYLVLTLSRCPGFKAEQAGLMVKCVEIQK